MVGAEAVSIDVRVGYEDSSADELDSLTRALLLELHNFDTERLELRPTGPAPKGSKAVDPVTLGAITIAVLPTLLPKIVEFLDHWTGRGTGRTLKLKLVRGDASTELELPTAGMSPEQVQQLLTTAKAAIAD